MTQQASHGAAIDFCAGPDIGTGSAADVTAALVTAALNPDYDSCGSVVASARHAGMTGADFADICIPAAARALGDMWCDDELAFALVTIGTARLQGLLRQIEAEYPIGQMGQGDCRAVVIVVPKGVQHTLGPQHIAGRLRRRGMCVKLLIDAEPVDLKQHLQRTTADAVFISGSCIERLEYLRPFVEEVRNIARDVPVVIGGPVPTLTLDVCAITLADYATCDLDEALRLCGLFETRQHAKPAEMMM